MIHWPSLILAVSMFALLQVAAVLRSPIPGPVLVVVLSFALDLQGLGVAVVGNIPTTLPSLHVPEFGGLPFDRVVLGALAIFLVSFGSGIVTARSFGALGHYHVDSNRELTGFGAANLAAGFTGAFPVTASDSRTAINAVVGGRSQLATLVAAAALIGTLLFLGPALKALPIPALGAILVAAALSLIDIGALKHVWRVSPMEFAFALTAMAGPVSLGVLYGVVIAISATLLYLLRKMMFPRDAMLGRKPGSDGFHKLHRDPLARPIPGMAIYLVQGSLLFFNADYVEARLREIAGNLPIGTEWLILDASAIVQIDSTGAAMLDNMRTELSRDGIVLGVAELHAEAYALLERAGLIGRMGNSMIFDDLNDALHAFESRVGKQA